MRILGGESAGRDRGGGLRVKEEGNWSAASFCWYYPIAFSAARQLSQQHVTRRFSQPRSSQSALRAFPELLVPSLQPFLSHHNGFSSLHDASGRWSVNGLGHPSCRWSCIHLVLAAVCCESRDKPRTGAPGYAPGATASYVLLGGQLSSNKEMLTNCHSYSFRAPPCPRC